MITSCSFHSSPVLIFSLHSLHPIFQCHLYHLRFTYPSVDPLELIWHVALNNPRVEVHPLSRLGFSLRENRP